jgi:hypothetical protein
MYQRYLKILDAVDKSGLYLRDLTGPQKAKVREQARVASMGDPDRYDDLETQFMTEARRKAAVLDEDTLNSLYATAEERAKETPGFANKNQPAQLRLIDDIYNELFDEASSTTVQPLALNAEGYKVALETLQQQFPYFIKRTGYEPLRTDKNATGEQIGGRGFLETRGLPTLMGAKQRSFASDSGYVRPGALRPNTARDGFFAPSGPEVPLKEYRGGKKGEERPWARSEQTGTEGSGQGVGGTAGPGAAGDGAAGPKSPAASPVERALSDMQQAADKQAETALKNLQFALTSLPRVSQDALRDKTWNDVKSASVDDPAKTRWIFAHGMGSLSTILEDEEGRKLLSDPSRVKAAFTAVYNDGASLDDALMDPDSSVRSLLGGAENAQKAADNVATMVQQIMDAKEMTAPFVDPASTQSGIAYHKGPKPQRLAGYVEYTAPEQIANGPADVQALSPVVAEIGYDQKGGYLPADQVARNVTERIKVLEAINQQIGVLANSSEVRANPDALTVERVARNTGESPERLAWAMGKPVQTIGDLRRVNVESRALELQRAWTLLTTERSIHLMRGGSPKEPLLRRELKPEGSPPTQQEPEEEAETAKAFSSRHKVSRLPANHPLAIEVALRKAAGKPLLPT